MKKACFLTAVIALMTLPANANGYDYLTFEDNSGQLKRVGGQVPDSLLSWNCRRSAISGCQCFPFGALAKVMRNDE